MSFEGLSHYSYTIAILFIAVLIHAAVNMC